MNKHEINERVIRALSVTTFDYDKGVPPQSMAGEHFHVYVTGILGEPREEGGWAISRWEKDGHFDIEEAEYHVYFWTYLTNPFTGK